MITLCHAEGTGLLWGLILTGIIKERGSDRILYEAMAVIEKRKGRGRSEGERQLLNTFGEELTGFAEQLNEEDKRERDLRMKS